MPAENQAEQTRRNGVAMQGWSKLHRQLLDSPLWLSEPFTRGQAWVDLFSLASHSPSHFRVRGIRIDVDRGQLAYSELTLSTRWKWSRGKVRRFLRELENDQMLATKQDNKTTIITILNYDKYQGEENDDDTANGTASGTPNGQQTDTFKNVKNEKHKKNPEDRILFVEGSIELRLATYLFNCIRLNRPEFKQPDLQAWAKHVDLMLRLDKRDAEHVREVIKWAQADNVPQEGSGFCWAVNILSTAKLRKQFDQLAIKMAAATQAPPGAPRKPRATTVFQQKQQEGEQKAIMLQRIRQEREKNGQGRDPRSVDEGGLSVPVKALGT